MQVEAGNLRRRGTLDSGRGSKRFPPAGIQSGSYMQVGAGNLQLSGLQFLRLIIVKLQKSVSGKLKSTSFGKR